VRISNVRLGLVLPQASASMASPHSQELGEAVTNHIMYVVAGKKRPDIKTWTQFHEAVERHYLHTIHAQGLRKTLSIAGADTQS
jgi:hypothetical protein